MGAFLPLPHTGHQARTVLHRQELELAAACVLPAGRAAGEVGTRLHPPEQTLRG